MYAKNNLYRVYHSRDIWERISDPYQILSSIYLFLSKPVKLDKTLSGIYTV